MTPPNTTPASPIGDAATIEAAKTESVTAEATTTGATTGAVTAEATRRPFDGGYGGDA